MQAKLRYLHFRISIHDSKHPHGRCRADVPATPQEMPGCIHSQTTPVLPIYWAAVRELQLSDTALNSFSNSSIYCCSRSRYHVAVQRLPSIFVGALVT